MPTPAVFVSYSHEEPDRSYVDKLTRHLDQAGVPVWYDHAIVTGQEWERVVAERIDSCPAFVVVMTPAAGGSSWVAREIARAEQAGRTIVPMLLDGEVFFRLGTLHYDDVRGGIMPSEACVRRLRELVAAPHATWGGVWAMQTPDAGLTARPELIEPLVDRLTGVAGETVAVSTALHGAGGFGKTTLARQACADPRVRARFRDGVWVTVGEDTAGPTLAERVNDVSYQLTGARPALSDPDQAGLRLGTLLDRRDSVLLVVDDVWRPEQLRPFLHGGTATCTRLITTRRPSALPAGARRSAFEVDQLTDAQARSLLTAGLPELRGPGLVDLIKLTGRWPLLVQLAHRYLTLNTRRGDPGAAIARLVTRLAEGGPAVLNLRDETSRERAVSASIAASMDLLTEAERDRFVELGIFAEDIDIPREALTLLWGVTGGLDPADVDQLCDLLGDLSLVADHTADRLRLHDVIRAYLRRRGRRELGPTNAALVAAARQLIPGPEPSAWWRLPDSQDYLWRHLGQHLVDAGADQELDLLVTDLRWIEAKLRRYGPSAVDVDLTQTEYQVAVTVRHTLRQNAHLFRPLEPRQALADTLVSRLWDAPGMAAALDAYVATMAAGARLVPRWPLPDRAHPALQQVLTGHRRTVSGCVLSPDDRWLATISHDGTSRIWDARTGALRQTLTGHTDEVLSGAAAPDGSWLVTTSRDRTARIWEVRTGIARHTLTGHASPVTACAVAPDSSWLVTAGQDRTARIWDARTGALRHTLVGHSGWVTSCAVAPDGRWLLTTSKDRTARIWDAATGTAGRILAGHTGDVLAGVVGPDGTWAATAGGDGTARIWDTATGGLRHTLLGHAGPVTSCAVAGRRLATTSLDGTARLWDVSGGASIHAFAHGDAVLSCAAAPEGSWLVTTSADRTARIWDATDGRPLHTLTGHTDRVLSCAVAADGRWLATTGDDRTVRIWEPAATGSDRGIAGHTDNVVAFAFAPGGAWGASASRDGSARTWDAGTGAPKLVYSGHAGPVLAVAIAPDGSWLATGGLDATARIWDAGDATTSRHVLAGHAREIVACAIGPDGTWLVTASRDGTARIWDSGAGTVRSVLRGHTDELLGCAVSPDGTWLATIGRDDTARIWDTRDGIAGLTLGHANEVRSCAIAPDGSWLLTTCNDRTARIWPVATGVAAHVLTGHTAAVTCCTIGSDGTWVATGGADHTVRTWDARTGAPRHTLTGHTGRITACAIAPGGRWLATTSTDATVRIWRLETGEPVTAVQVTEPVDAAVWHPTARTLVLAGRGGLYAFDLVD